jgi:predicted permease
VAVIDEAMARLLFAGQDPIGRRVSIGGPDQPGIEIVGVVGHVKQWGLDTDDAARIRAQLYTPFAGIPDFLLKTFATGSTIVLRTRSNPLSIADAVRAQVIGADRDQPVYNVRTMDQIVTGTMAERRFTLLLLGSFAGIALLLASVGIYGVIAYSVSQRTREIGIRMALGARRQDVLKLVVGHCAMLALTGVGAGLVLASLVTRALSKLLFGVGARDPMTLAVVSALLILVALLASFLPARRAARVDPMVALRYE